MIGENIQNASSPNLVVPPIVRSDEDIKQGGVTETDREYTSIGQHKDHPRNWRCNVTEDSVNSSRHCHCNLEPGLILNRAELNGRHPPRINQTSNDTMVKKISYINCNSAANILNISHQDTTVTEKVHTGANIGTTSVQIVSINSTHMDNIDFFITNIVYPTIHANRQYYSGTFMQYAFTQRHNRIKESLSQYDCKKVPLCVNIVNRMIDFIEHSIQMDMIHAFISKIMNAPNFTVELRYRASFATYVVSQRSKGIKYALLGYRCQDSVPCTELKKLMISIADSWGSNDTRPLGLFPDSKKPVHYHVNIYIFPVILVIGTIGNVLSIVVFLRKSLRATSMSIYLICLAIMDNVVLFLHTFDVLLVELNVLIIHKYNAACKTLAFLQYVTVHIEVWIIVIVTLERTAAILFPMKCKIWFTKLRSCMYLLGNVIILMCVNAHFFWTIGIVPEITNLRNNVTLISFSCLYSEPKYKHYLQVIWPVIDIIISSILPSIILLIGNSIICHQLYKSYVLRHQAANTQDQSHLTHTYVIMVAIVIVCIVTTLPRTMWALFTDYLVPFDYETDLQITYGLMCLHSLNYALNFFLYCISGGQFRKELIQLFVSCKSQKCCSCCRSATEADIELQ